MFLNQEKYILFQCLEKRHRLFKNSHPRYTLLSSERNKFSRTVGHLSI